MHSIRSLAKYYVDFVVGCIPTGLIRQGHVRLTYINALSSCMAAATVAIHQSSIKRRGY